MNKCPLMMTNSSPVISWRWQTTHTKQSMWKKWSLARRIMSSCFRMPKQPLHLGAKRLQKMTKLKQEWKIIRKIHSLVKMVLAIKEPIPWVTGLCQFQATIITGHTIFMPPLVHQWCQIRVKNRPGTTATSKQSLGLHVDQTWLL